jgi:mRNA-degrading endonuclease RelE of RelBE toxin-antitoxin system
LSRRLSRERGKGTGWASLDRDRPPARPPGCKKLKGGDNEWRIRVGDYRIVYEIDDRARTVDVTRIAHRREAYD